MNTLSLLIRVDASSEIGTGHIMRMIALAQAWQDRGGDVVIATCHCPDTLVARLGEENIAYRRISAAELGGVEDCAASVALAKEFDCRWVVVDGYHFNIQYQRGIRNAGFKLLVVDDHGYCDSWCAHAILNQNIHAPSCEYRFELADCQLLLGTKYALLRREFVQSPPDQSRPMPERIDRLLVTLGGGDPENVTGKVLGLLEQVDVQMLRIRVLVGGSNPHRHELAVIAKQSRHQIDLLTNVRDMPAQYAWADGIISAAGSTCWEWMYYRLPAAVVSIAKNQRPIARALRERRLAVDLGWHERLASKATRELLVEFIGSSLVHQRGKTIFVDARGADRVCDHLMDADVVGANAHKSAENAASVACK